MGNRRFNTQTRKMFSNGSGPVKMGESTGLIKGREIERKLKELKQRRKERGSFDPSARPGPTRRQKIIMEKRAKQIKRSKQIKKPKDFFSGQTKQEKKRIIRAKESPFKKGGRS
jgi:hypothetical protein